MLELAGIRDVLAKSLGTTTPINMTRATVEGLREPRAPRGRRPAAGQDDRRGDPDPRAATLAREEAALAKERAEAEQRRAGVWLEPDARVHDRDRGQRGECG